MAAVLPVQVGLKARGVTLSLVCLACVFITLSVAIGAGIHKNYDAPTPVRNSPFMGSYPFLPADVTGSVLVLDQLTVLERTSW